MAEQDQKSSLDMEKRVAQYVAVRDLLKHMDEAHQEKRKELVVLLDTLTGVIQKFLNDHSMQNLSTKAGTCYLSSRTTASLSDPAAFMDYVIANRQFDLLDRRANATAVKAFVEANKALPPGCNLSTVETLGVRRK